MDRTARLYLCARCRRQRVICRTCDRGQRYCGADCAQAARSATQRAAGVRYQDSRAGRFTHAARQRRYRARQNKVTHQGSPSQAAGVSLRASVSPAAVPTRALFAASVLLCAICGRACAPHLRRDFLRCVGERHSIHPRRIPRPSG